MAPKKFQNCSDDWHRWRFWSAFRHLGTHFAESFRMSKSSWMMDPTRSCEMPSYSAIDLTEIRRSSKIISCIWSVISGVVTVLGHPGRGASQVEKSPRLNGPTSFWQWHTMVHVPLMFLSEWREFALAPCLAGKKKRDDSSRLHVVEIARVAWHASFQPLLEEKTCNSACEQTSLSNNTINSVLRHREVGRAKDYQHPLVLWNRYLRWWNVKALW